MNSADTTVRDALLRLLGMGGDIPPGAALKLQWTNLPQSWWVFVFIGVVLAMGVGVLALYWREIDTCPKAVKWLLGAIRCLVALVLVLIFLGPSLGYTITRVRQPYVVVLRDASQSMNTADQYSSPSDVERVAAATGWSIERIRSQRPSRVAILNELLQRDDGDFVRKLQQRGNVRILDFSDRARPVETRPMIAKSADRGAAGGGADDDHPTASPVPLLVAEGRATDIHDAIESALDSEPLAAIVLFSDGQPTASGDSAMMMRQISDIARRAGQQQAPLLVVGLGDPSRQRNLKVAKVYARPQVWQDEPFEIEALLQTEGFEQREVRVLLLEQKYTAADDRTQPPGVVQSKHMNLPPGGAQQRVSFAHTVKQPGSFVYTVQVEPVAGERTTDDNQKDSPVVNVLDRQKVGVLLVAGAPSWEYLMLQRLLTRDPTISVSCWLQTLDLDRPQEGNRPITHLPADPRELFAYDVVILLDPNPRGFDQPWIDLLKRFVAEHAGGVLYMAGPKFSGSFLTGERTGAMADVLPVRFDDVGATEVAALLSTNREAWPLRVVSANVDHAVMSFYQDRQESLARWESLPGIYWSFPALVAKPTAQVLVEHSNPTLRRVEGSRPLMVVGRYGAGNTMYLGFNGTWRWRRVGRQAEFFDRFWIQSVRHLVSGRSLQGHRRGSIRTDQDRYELGDRVSVTARLFDASYQPLDVDKMDATFQESNAQPVSFTLRRIEDQPGRYQAVFTPRRTGDHLVRIELPSSDEDEPSRIEANFSVELPRVETNQVWLDKSFLTTIADDSGGRYFDVDQLDQLAAAIGDASQRIDIPSQPIKLWSIWPVLLLLVALLSVEWTVRKSFTLL